MLVAIVLIVVLPIVTANNRSNNNNNNNRSNNNNNNNHSNHNSTRYVKIDSLDSIMLAEIEIYDANGVNLALNKVVTGSVPRDVSQLSYAVDGYAEPPFSFDTYYITNEYPSWIQVDLGSDFPVARVKILLTSDGFDAKLRNSTVTGYNANLEPTWQLDLLEAADTYDINVISNSVFYQTNAVMQ